jgi:hypothetical protein
MSDSVLLGTVFMFQVSPLSLSLSLYSHNASAMADIILIRSEKYFSKSVGTSKRY